MRLVLLHNEISEEATAAERDVLVQRNAIAAALSELGHESLSLGCTLDLSAVARALESLRPDVVFNLVEQLGGTDRLMSLAPLLLDGLNLPYTGCDTQAIFATTNKVAAKERLRAAGLPTPAWIGSADSCSDVIAEAGNSAEPRLIIKPIWEHASFGLDDDSILPMSESRTIAAAIRRREQATGRPHFAEAFVEGREFNLSLLAADDSQAAESQPLILPPAEIDFSAFPKDKPRIVGHRAKWEEDSFEYQGTPRTFAFSPADLALLNELSDLARRCWRLFNLRGYARVDFRVDPQGRPWILEVNANPCLAPDAGFAAALERGSLSFASAIHHILSHVQPHRFQEETG